MDLINKLQDFYRNKEVGEIQKSLGNEVEILKAELLDLANTFFIDKTNNLKVWEELLEIKIDTTKTNEFRKERVKAKLRGQGTTTKFLMENVASAFSGGEVEVIEDSANNKFTIKFVGKLGIPANMEDLELSIEEIKPAHLIFDFKYSYRTHKTLESYTHSQLSSFSHNTLREGDI